MEAFSEFFGAGRRARLRVLLDEPAQGLGRIAPALDPLVGGGQEEEFAVVVGVEIPRDEYVVESLSGSVVGVVELGEEEVVFDAAHLLARAPDGVLEEFVRLFLSLPGEGGLTRLAVDFGQREDVFGVRGLQFATLEVLFDGLGGAVPLVELRVALGHANQEVGAGRLGLDGLPIGVGRLDHLLVLDVEAGQTDVVLGARLGPGLYQFLAPGDGLGQFAELLVVFGEERLLSGGSARGIARGALEGLEHVVAAAGGAVGQGEDLVDSGIGASCRHLLVVADGLVALGLGELGIGAGDVRGERAVRRSAADHGPKTPESMVIEVLFELQSAQ